MYVVKIIGRDGTVYMSGPIVSVPERARSMFDDQLLTGRFVRAELWSGTFDGNAWSDGSRIAEKAA